MTITTSRLHVIYVPGLGDANVRGQAGAVRLWRWFGIEAEMVRMHWAVNEPWGAKKQHLLERIDILQQNGNRVALVGSSAGAIPVITAFAERPDVVGVVVIAGKVNRPDTIGEGYRRTNPALVDAAQDCQRALGIISPADRRRITSRFAWRDEIVSREDSYIPGARNQQLWSIGHVLTIAIQITFGMPLWLRFLR